MKVRTDYVTNSSSVSFILTVHPEVSSIRLKSLGHDERPSTHTQLLAFARDKIMSQGAQIEVDGEAIYAMPVSFQTDGDCELLETYGIGGEDFYVKPLPVLSDEKMLELLYGLFIFGQGDLFQTMSGFGATQTETF